MDRSTGRVIAGFYLAVTFVATYINLGSPIAIVNPGLGDLPLYILLGLHYLWGGALLLGSTEWQAFRRGSYRRLLFFPELLAAGSLLFFLFAMIFALNANLDYVQRFIQSGGNLRLAMDTTTEQLLVWVRIFPLVAVNLGIYLLFRIGRYSLVVGVGNDRRAERDAIVRPWAFLLTLLSAFAATVAMPSFLSLDGFPVLGWIAYVPLFLVFRFSRPGHAMVYGITFGGFTTLLTSYWLGTFSLVSLQITVLFFLLYYVIFTPITLWLYRRARFARVLIFPLAFTLFEYLRSTGFLGYPWALAAHSQYSVLPVIQMVEWTGVWGLSFLVLLANSAIAEFLGALFVRLSIRRAQRTGSGWALHASPHATVRRTFQWLAATAGLVGIVILAGGIFLVVNPDARSAGDDPRTITVAQIQQNNDPRKAQYERTFATLRRLTDEAMASQPDLVVWSETAFVPNIRRWSQDTSSTRFNRLVNSFLEYQDGLGTWLVTGNDDYDVIRDADGREIERLNYNAAVLFSDLGHRRETYHKIQLVPFTEYFPYREQLPWVYELLLEFDVYFWEPGDDPVIFEHPLFTFSTPICYEDVFPGYVRTLVRDGAEAILNLSNDYWSLTEVQAKQHFVAGLFRAVENRRPVLRTTSSGLTGHIDTHGRILQTAPYFEEAYLVSELEIPARLRTTLYTRLGDYFPIASGVGLLVILIVSLLRGPASVAGGASRRTAVAGARDTVTGATGAYPSASGAASRPAGGSPEATGGGTPPPALDGAPGMGTRATPSSSRPAPDPGESKSPGSSADARADQAAPPSGENQPQPRRKRQRRKKSQRINWREIWDD